MRLRVADPRAGKLPCHTVVRVSVFPPRPRLVHGGANDHSSHDQRAVTPHIRAASCGVNNASSPAIDAQWTPTVGSAGFNALQVRLDSARTPKSPRPRGPLQCDSAYRNSAEEQSGLPGDGSIR